MISKLLQVIKEASDLIEKYQIDKDSITKVHQDLSKIDHMMEESKESDITSHTTK